MEQAWSKPAGIVSCGGVSGGSRGVTALEPVLVGVGLVRAGAEVEIPFAATRLVDGVFVAQEKNTAVMIKQLVGLATLAETLKPLR